MGKVAKHSKPLVIALTMLLMVKAGLACTTIPGYPDPTIENVAYIKLYFFLWFAMIVGNLAIFFIRGRNGLWIIVLSACAMVVLLPFTLFGMLGGDCGIRMREWLFYDVIVFAALLAAQIASWILQKRGARIRLR